MASASQARRPRARAEDRGAHSYVGGAEPDRRLVVAAHADADQRPGRCRAASLASSAVCRATSSSSGGIAISPAERKAELAAAQCHEGVELARRHARLLRLLAGVDLDEQPRRARPAAPSPWPARGRAWAGPASGSRRTAPRPRPPCWICSPPIRCSSTPGQRCRSSGQRPCGLLDVVLAEHALAGRERRLDPRPRAATCDTAIRVTASAARPAAGRRRGDPRAHRGQVARDLALLTRLRHGVLAPLAVHGIAGRHRMTFDEIMAPLGAEAFTPRLSGAAAAAPARPGRQVPGGDELGGR